MLWLGSLRHKEYRTTERQTCCITYACFLLFTGGERSCNSQHVLQRFGDETVKSSYSSSHLELWNIKPSVSAGYIYSRAETTCSPYVWAHIPLLFNTECQVWYMLCLHVFDILEGGMVVQWLALTARRSWVEFQPGAFLRGVYVLPVPVQVLWLPQPKDMQFG